MKKAWVQANLWRSQVHVPHLPFWCPWGYTLEGTFTLEPHPPQAVMLSTVDLGYWQLSRCYSLFFPVTGTSHSLIHTPNKALRINWSCLKCWRVNGMWLSCWHRATPDFCTVFPILHSTPTWCWAPHSHLCLPSAVLAPALARGDGFLSSLPSSSGHARKSSSPSCAPLC